MCVCLSSVRALLGFVCARARLTSIRPIPSTRHATFPRQVHNGLTMEPRGACVRTRAASDVHRASRHLDRHLAVSRRRRRARCCGGGLCFAANPVPPGCHSLPTQGHPTLHFISRGGGSLSVLFFARPSPCDDGATVWRARGVSAARVTARPFGCVFVLSLVPLVCSPLWRLLSPLGRGGPGRRVHHVVPGRRVLLSRSGTCW